MEIAADDAAIKRRLRLELTAHKNPDALAAEVRKRLGQIGRATSPLDTRQARQLASELDRQRRTIVERIAKVDAAEALSLMWQFTDMATDVVYRCTDRDDLVGDVFTQASEDLGPLAAAAKLEPAVLADRAFEALQQRSYGPYGRLIETIAPSLGASGLAHLEARFEDLAKAPVKTPAKRNREVIGYSLEGPIYQDEFELTNRASIIRNALLQIADVRGDVDSYVAQFDEIQRKSPGVATEIAQRLIAANRPADALSILDAAQHRRPDLRVVDWDDTRIEALDALGRDDEAQAARWSCFERSLSSEHLRAYLQRLPDFEDVEAERRALDHVETYQYPIRALAFLLSWPAHERAARFIIRHAGKLDGNIYEILSPAADALAGKYPLAATLALRAMIDFTLKQDRSARYRHAARHLLECESLAAGISDFAGFDNHVTYKLRLRSEHGRKASFWSLLAAE